MTAPVTMLYSSNRGVKHFNFTMNFKLIIFLTLTIEIIYAQVPSVHVCPNVRVVDNFDAKEYMGKWYEIKRYFAIFEIGAKCVTAHYGLNDDGTVSVINSQINKLTKLMSSISGYARFASTPNIAKLILHLTLVPVDGNYWVLGTDYENYSVVWSCTQLGPISLRFAWILTRERNPSDEVLNEANKVLIANNISPNAWFTTTDQRNCPNDY